MTAFLLDMLVKASALLAVAALGDRALGNWASAATRHLLWSLAIAALLALPVASLTLPSWAVRIPVPRVSVAPPAATEAAPSNTVADADAALRATAAPRSPTSVDGASAPPSASRAVSPVAAAVVLYAIGIAWLLARRACEPFALRRLTRAAHLVADPAWRRALDDAARQLRVTRPVRLFQSRADVMPMTFGTRAPAIVLPASAGGWNDDRRRAVLLHELAHVARRDCLVQRATALACAIYWPHPGVWWAARRLRVERELACDDRVLAAGAPAHDYAGHLLEIAHAFRAVPAPAAALGMARTKQLEHRLLAILDEARNRASLGRVRRSVFVAAAIALFIPVAVLRAALVPSDLVSAESVAGPVLAIRGFVGQQDFTGTWEVHPSHTPGQVQLTIRRGQSTHGRTLPLAELERLAGTTLAAATTVHFPIRRDAGTFTIEGTCRNSACAGTFVFEPSATFAAELAKRGIGQPTPQDQFQLAVADVGPAYLDTLASAGYKTPDIQLLVRAAQHGVERGYIRDMADLGYKLGTVDRLMTLRDHGVDPEYVRGMAANGVKGLTADELVRTRDHGVDPEYIRGLAALGYTGLSVEALVTARDHGVDPQYVGGMQRLGYKQTLDDLRRTRDHGVDPEYVRGMAALGYKGVTLDELVRMRDHGVDPEYVRRLQQRGVSNLPVDEIIQRRDRGGE
jgi:beta-lactamase regulating signal transducer with metallopeptidase domain